MNADTFLLDLRGRIEYFRKEFHISYSEAIGVLAMLQFELQKEAFDSLDNEEDDTDRG